MTRGDRLSALFVTRKWPPAVGGMETYSRELTRHLQDRLGLDVLFLPGRPDGSPPRQSALAWFLLRAALHLRRGASHWDVVHFGDPLLVPLARLHARWAPDRARVLTVYGLDLVYGRRPGPAPWLYRRFVRDVSTWSDVIDRTLAISRNTARLALEAGLDRVDVVPLGVRPAPLLPSPQGEAGGAAIVLTVGRVVRRKGALWLASEVLPRIPDEVELHVIGTAWDAAELQGLREQRRTIYLGYGSPEALEEAYGRCRCVVVPNIPTPGGLDVEGFGLTAVEAAVRGVPTLVADLEGLRDAVIDGVTGFLVPSGDADAWTRKLREVLGWDSRTRRSFARRCRTAALEHFSWVRVVDATLEVYEKALHRAAGRASIET